MTDLHVDPTTRRSLLRRAGVAGAAGIGLGALDLASSGHADLDEADAATLSCVLTPEQTEGPYYIAAERVRRNIREGKAGLAVRLRVRVVNTAAGCGALRNAAVDVWHCDALGVYSGVSGNRGTFLRGVQLTNAGGYAYFDTVYPGWYPGRAIHIHMKVHYGGAVSNGHHVGGHVTHTGQLFFPESLSSRVQRLAPYNRHTGNRTLITRDNIYTGSHGSSGLLRSGYLNSRRGLSGGLLSVVNIGVNPASTPAATR